MEILGADSHWLYWRDTQASAGFLMRVPLAGGTPWRLRATPSGRPIIDAEGSAWVDEKQGSVWWTPAATSQARPLLHGTKVSWLGKADGALLAVVPATANPSSRSVLLRLPLDGGPPVKLLSDEAFWWESERELRLTNLRTGRLRRVKLAREGNGWSYLGQGRVAWVAEDGLISRAHLDVVGSRPPKRSALLDTLSPALQKWLVERAGLNKDPDPGWASWRSSVCSRLPGAKQRPDEERCVIEVVGGGRALAVTSTYGCGQDSCSTASWIVTKKGKLFTARPEISSIEYLAERDEILGERSVQTGSGWSDEQMWLYAHATDPRRRPLRAFAPCFSARVSPGGKWIVCRDKGGNVLRVGLEGGPPEVIHRHLFPEQVPYSPYSLRIPGPVHFLSPSRVLVSDEEGEDEILPWSEAGSWPWPLQE